MVLWFDFLYFSSKTIRENRQFISDEIITTTTKTQRYILAFKWSEKTRHFQRFILQYWY